VKWVGSASRPLPVRSGVSKTATLLRAPRLAVRGGVLPSGATPLDKRCRVWLPAARQVRGPALNRSTRCVERMSRASGDDRAPRGALACLKEGAHHALAFLGAVPGRFFVTVPRCIGACPPVPGPGGCNRAGLCCLWTGRYTSARNPLGRQSQRRSRRERYLGDEGDRQARSAGLRPRPHSSVRGEAGWPL
jgi:hypothetical protein